MLKAVKKRKKCAVGGGGDEGENYMWMTVLLKTAFSRFMASICRQRTNEKLYSSPMSRGEIKSCKGGRRRRSWLLISWLLIFHQESL